jgi:hypothetical protein
MADVFFGNRARFPISEEKGFTMAEEIFGAPMI